MQAMSSLQHVLNIDHDRLRIVMPHLKSLIKKQGLNPNWQKAGQLSTIFASVVGDATYSYWNCC